MGKKLKTGCLRGAERHLAEARSVRGQQQHRSVYDKYKDVADSYYVNTWYSEDQIDALFQ